MATHAEMAYQAPPSPTLTNPDMILPDMEYDRSTSPDRSEALMMWKNAQIGDMSFSLPPSQFLNMMGINMNMSAPITPTTPIIYGNGTMLSDIGEVTEVESTVGRSSRPASPMVPRMTSRAALRAGAPDSTTPSAYQSIKTKARIAAHERRGSGDSTSTITTNDHTAIFADFDDSASVGDSIFQGDDEESMAESYNEGVPARELLGGGRRNLGVDHNDEDRFSTISIGRRAEEILANAKRRLTTMEGNLNRARMYSGETYDDSELESVPSPTLQAGFVYDQSPQILQNGHARMNSDQSISMDTNQMFPRRSASALGAAGGYRHLSNSRSTSDLPQKTAAYNGSDNFPDAGLEEQASYNQHWSGQDETYLSPSHDQSSERGITRSTSAMQMRDIKDQVKDLKGKVSALRQQARADNLKRQSLQSLRNLSPFTHSVVDQWYAEGNEGEGEDENVQDPRATNSGVTTPTGNRSQDRIESDEEMSPVQLQHSIHRLDIDDDESASEYEDAERAMTPVSYQDPMDMDEIVKQRLGAVIDDDMRTEDGYTNDALSYDSDSGDSMYHDAPLPLSHEDREDAFDYEHFFLHSAMGTISQQRLERRGSFSSEDSVETTRGPIPTNPVRRRGSNESVSTVASFETADEGRQSRLKSNNSDGSGDGNALVRKSRDTMNSFHERPRPSTARPASAFRPSSSSDIPRSASSMSGSNAIRGSVIRRPLSTSAFRHRPSVSSFDSTGTNRSFPLVSKSRASMNAPPSRNGRPQSAGVSVSEAADVEQQHGDEDELVDIQERLLRRATSMASLNSPSVNGDDESQLVNATSMGMLHRDDQALVEQLVGSLGQCVLKLSEVSRASTDSRVLRRRMIAARRLLEGLDDELQSSGSTPQP